MAKFDGMVGYVIPTESEDNPGFWDPIETEKRYRGDINRTIVHSSPVTEINDGFSMNNEISILADSYANENFSFIRYVVIGGSKWKVSSVTMNSPRLVLVIGGLYNGN